MGRGERRTRRRACWLLVATALAACGDDGPRVEVLPPPPASEPLEFTIDLPRAWNEPSPRLERAFRRGSRKGTGGAAELRAVRGPDPERPEVALFVVDGPSPRESLDELYDDLAGNAANTRFDIELDGERAVAWDETRGRGRNRSDQFVAICVRGGRLVSFIFGPIRGRRLGPARSEASAILASLRWSP